MTGILLSAGAVIEDEKGRVLLVKHAGGWGSFWQGKWICPGGKLEVGEGIEEGVKREVREETGLEIELVRPLLPVEKIVNGDGRVELHVIYLDFLARPVGGKVRSGRDMGECLWVEKREFPHLWPHVHEDTKRLLYLAGVVRR
jgi:8-oxo-dGTP diphosphatase